MKLGDQDVQDAIAHFVDEARICSQTQRKDGVLGFAAVSLILSCVLAVGEALTGGKGGGDAARQAFYDEMSDLSWLLPPKGTAYTKAKALELLRDVRNGLAHALVLPDDVMLLPSLASDKEHEIKHGAQHLQKWRIVVPDFVDAVEATAQAICQKYPSRSWDPVGITQGWQRGPVAVLTTYNSVSGGSISATTSGSTVTQSTP